MTAFRFWAVTAFTLAFLAVPNVVTAVGPVRLAPVESAEAAPTPNVACGPICIGGDGRPPCQDWNLGSYWTPPGHKYVCVRIGSTDQWAIIY